MYVWICFALLILCVCMFLFVSLNTYKNDMNFLLANAKYI